MFFQRWWILWAILKLGDRRGKEYQKIILIRIWWFIEKISPKAIKLRIATRIEIVGIIKSYGNRTKIRQRLFLSILII